MNMRLIIVDDDRLVALSLQTILEASKEVSVCALGKDGEEAVCLYETYLPDVLLMDIRMETMSGLEAAREILKKYPEAKILFLTTFSDDEYIIQALHLGAKGYILKQNFESLLPSLKAVMEGQNVFGDEIITRLPSLLSRRSSFPYEEKGISPRELELIELVAQGLSNREMAQKLFLSEGTIRNYLSVILEKLELRDRTQLAVFYYQNH